MWRGVVFCNGCRPQASIGCIHRLCQRLDFFSIVVENETGRDGRLQGRSELRKILLPAVRIECGELRVVERLRGSEQPQKARTLLTHTGNVCVRHLGPWGTQNGRADCREREWQEG